MARVTAVLALVLFTCSGVWAATTPTDALQHVFAQADKILTDPDSAEGPLERLLAIRKLVNEAFDFRSAAELASGDHWRARTAAEQEEFTWLFGDLLERAFVSRMASRANLEHGMRIKYLGESVDRGTALVQTAMSRRDGGDMLLDYQLIERDGSWKIRDVAIDGVSVMANYRAQLDRVLGNASFPELLTQMRAKVGAPEPPRTTPTIEVSLPAKPELSADVPPPAPELRAAALEPPPMTQPTRVHTTRAYWLEISTVEVAEAGRLVSRLRDGKFSVALQRTTAGGKPMVHVRVGPFQDAEEAVFKLLDLQTQGHDPFLIAERD